MIVTLIFAALAAAAEERPRYCDEPTYIVKGEPETHTDPRDEDILTREEANDPGRARALAALPGPYGHSQLGFRYLARLFGYRDWVFSREAVEGWLVRQEYEDHAQKKGLWDTWEHWVVRPEKRLAVPRGPLSALPADGAPVMFFLDERDRFAHARCVKADLATRLCENYAGQGRHLAEKDVVHFAATSHGAERYGYCTVYVPPWRRAQERQYEKRYGGADESKQAK